MPTKSTYVLFVPGTRGPSVRHDSLKAARDEASRLISIGSESVMICRYIEGMKRVTSTQMLDRNPLPTLEESTPF